jgi:hypothetical protein
VAVDPIATAAEGHTPERASLLVPNDAEQGTDCFCFLGVQGNQLSPQQPGSAREQLLTRDRQPVIDSYRNLHISSCLNYKVNGQSRRKVAAELRKRGHLNFQGVEFTLYLRLQPESDPGTPFPQVLGGFRWSHEWARGEAFAEAEDIRIHLTAAKRTADDVNGIGPQEHRKEADTKPAGWLESRTCEARVDRGHFRRLPERATKIEQYAGEDLPGHPKAVVDYFYEATTIILVNSNRYLAAVRLLQLASRPNCVRGVLNQLTKRHPDLKAVKLMSAYARREASDIRNSDLGIHWGPGLSLDQLAEADRILDALH